MQQREHLTREGVESRRRWMQYSEPGLRAVLERLAALQEEEEVDDYGISRPTDYAYDTACDLVVGAASHLGGRFPRGSASTDSEGGIRVEWIHREREVRLIVPAHEGGRMYVYHEAGEEYAVEEMVSAAILAHWLEWLTEA